MQDDVDTSLASEDAPSDFSWLAKSKDNPPANRDGSYNRTKMGRTLGEMSIAKLTSGVSDGDLSSR